MNRLHIYSPIILSLLLIETLAAQVGPPAPGKDLPSLIAILKSDAPDFEKAKACQQLQITGDVSAVDSLGALLSDPHLATYARSALESIPGEASLNALHKAVTELSGQQLVGALHSLGKLGKEQSVSLLAGFEGHKDPAVRHQAARALASIANADAAELLARQLVKAKSDSGDREALANACLLCAQRLNENKLRDVALTMSTALRAPEFSEQIRRAATLQYILAEGKGADQLRVELLASHDKATFRSGLQAAMRCRDRAKAARELAASLANQSSSHQEVLLTALTTYGDQNVTRSVMIAAESKDPNIQIAAIRALGTIGNDRCLGLLRKGAVSSDTSIAAAARLALAEVPVDAADDVALALLQSGKPPSVQAGIEIAGKRQVSAAAPLLIGLVAKSDPATRRAALLALGNTAGRDQIPTLIELTLKPRSDADSLLLKKTLKKVSIRAPQDECARHLTASFAKANTSGKIMLLEVLATVGGPRALATVAAAANSNDDSMRDAASQELGKWSTADAAPVLFKLATSSPVSKYKIRALRGFIRIARQLDMTLKERMEVCRKAINLATRNQERTLVLGVLSRYPSATGLKLAQSLAKHQAIKKQTDTAIATIRQALATQQNSEQGFVSMFDGLSLKGWKGDKKFWRIEDGAITGGSLKTMFKHNEFLRTEKQYKDFELRLQFQLTGKRTNGGIQIRTQEIPDDHEVSGYQADLGEGWWGCLYDESRRRRVLAGPKPADRGKPVRIGEWNDYRILCQGKRIQLWINGSKTVDYTEPDPKIPLEGIIAVQVHGNMLMIARYKNIRIKEL